MRASCRLGAKLRDFGHLGARSLVVGVAGLTLVGLNGANYSAYAATTNKIAANTQIDAVAAENEYANVIQQLGGPYVRVSAIMKNPNTDPHTFEASPIDARMVATARLVVANGAGYDSFITKLESASPDPHRVTIIAQKVIGVPATVSNPHLFYKPGEMTAVAGAITAALIHLEPRHATFFRSRLNTFKRSLTPWRNAISLLKRTYGGAKVAVTEPVADYMLNAAGMKIMTPWAFQAAIMNSVDPSPQDVLVERNLILHRQVRVFVYNQQAVDATTETLLALAKREKLPVVGVYETMPPGHDYQTWMLDETMDVYRALRNHRSYFTL